jgi:uncharacterized protein
MLLWSTMVGAAVFGVFLTLEATEIILFIGNFAGSSGTVKLGGYVGILTALVAWYASAAGVINSMRGAPFLPVGKPFGAGQGRLPDERPTGDPGGAGRPRDHLSF